MTTTHHTTLPGGLTLLTRDGALVAGGWCEARVLWERLQRRPGGVPGPLTPGVSGSAAEVLTAYLAGDVGALDELRVVQRGTPHQERVWQALREVPAGTTVTYAELAAEVGTGSRALGSACGANLVAPVVPCHRVVRSDGSLGGYAWGLATKRLLLDLEAAAIHPPPSTTASASS